MYRGLVRLNGTTHYSIAIKKMTWSSICDNGMQCNFKKEAEKICQLRHPNVVPFLGFCVDHDEKILVYMYIPCRSLHFHLHGESWFGKIDLTWKERLEICIGVAQGIDYLHTANIFHLNTLFKKEKNFGNAEH